MIDEETPTQHGFTSIPYTPKSHSPTPTKKGLIYVSATVNSQAIHVLLNTGATHNFISKDKAKCLGLKMTKEWGTIKVVNSFAKSIAGPTKACMWYSDVDWKSRLLHRALNDFNIVLSMEFFNQINVFPLLAINSLIIIYGSMACMFLLRASRPQRRHFQPCNSKRFFRMT